MNKILSLILCWVACCLNTLGQSAGYFPDLYTGYFYHMTLANPSYVADTGKLDIMLGHKLMSGPFKEISASSLLAGKNFGTSQRTQSIKVVLANEQEGEYINTPKIMLNYAYRLLLAHDMHLALGASMGTTGVYWSAPSASSSFYLPDGNLGLRWQRKTSSIGLSSFQVFNASSRAFYMKRYYHVDASTSRPISPFWDVKMYGLWRVLPSSKDEFRLAVLAAYSQKIEFGLALKNHWGLSAMGKFSIDLHSSRSNLVITAVYNVYRFSKDRILPNSFELGLAYRRL